MKILAVCGAGVGTSVLLKMNAEKALRTLDLEAEVSAVNLATALETQDAQIILTTPDLVEKLAGTRSEVIAIEGLFDLNEISEKLEKALG
jgi:PTS system ascorbate-specific IIB component